MARRGKSNQDREILIQKVKIRSEAHGGSAWKVAYADFVTAMMAFFLLLWLVSATTEDQKKGISNYFEPIGAPRGSTGSDGVFAGISATDPGPIVEPGLTTARSIDAVRPEEQEIDGAPATAPTKPDAPRNLEEIRQFEAAKIAIQRAFEQVPELADLSQSIEVEEIEEGLRIRILDREERPLFAHGGAELNDDGRTLLKLIANVIDRMPNEIRIAGFTATGEDVAANGRSGWRLSLQRAYAGHRALLAMGVQDSRVAAVEGRADLAPVENRPAADPSNRRVEVTLLKLNERDELAERLPPSLTPQGH